MKNPWLTVPLTDYEGHMSHDGVRQLEPLSELFRWVIELCKPESVAVMGVAGGNGLEHIDSAITRRVVGVDLNQEYLEAARERFSALTGLELCCADLRGQSIPIAPVALVHAALIFEHTGLDPALENAIGLVAEGGWISVVLQLPSQEQAGVALTGYESMQRLKAGFALIEPGELCELVRRRGFRQSAEERRSLPGGKGLWMGVFNRSAK